MNILKTNIDGVPIIESYVFKDSRVYFFESFSQRKFDEKVTPILGHNISFVSNNKNKNYSPKSDKQDILAINICHETYCR